MNKVFNTLKEVVESKDLTYLDKVVFSSLITFNGRNKIFPSLLEIGKRTGCGSINNISVSLNKLKKAGFIKIIRRFQKSSIYIIKDEASEMKTKIIKQKPKEVPDRVRVKTEVEYMNEGIVQIVAQEVAKAKGRAKTESSDFAFVNSMLKLKGEDRYSDDNFNMVRKCLMLLYLINIHSDKFENGNNPYAYLTVVYSNNSYSDIRKKIFESRAAKKALLIDKNILQKPNY